MSVQQNPFSSVSNRFGLIMGCDYPRTAARLFGCVNDANHMFNFYTTSKGFKETDIVKLYNESMTKANMLDYLKKFAEKTHEIARSGKTPECILYYAGHGIKLPPGYKKSRESIQRSIVRKIIERKEPVKGTSINDKTGDQSLVPYDYTSKGVIVDDTLFSEFIAKLHSDTQLFIFTDCCHSGTNFDLQYQNIHNLYSKNGIQTKVIQLAGCQDNQTAAEVNGRGVATSRFISSMTNKNIVKIEDLKNAMKDVSISGNVQHPQVSVSNEQLVNGNLFNWLETRNLKAAINDRKDFIIKNVVDAARNIRNIIRPNKQ